MLNTGEMMIEAMVDNIAWQYTEERIERAERNPWPSPEVGIWSDRQARLQVAAAEFGYLLH